MRALYEGFFASRMTHVLAFLLWFVVEYVLFSFSSSPSFLSPPQVFPSVSHRAKGYGNFTSSQGRHKVP